MMARWSNAAKCRLRPAFDDQIRGQHCSPSGAHRGTEGIRTHRRIGIELRETLLGRCLADRIKIGMRMHPRDLGHACQRRFMAL